MGKPDKNQARHWLAGLWRRLCPIPRGTTRDTVRITLYGLEMEVTREIGSDMPYEVTVVVPRAEFRRKCPAGADGGCECELILNSITIAHSPRPTPAEQGRAGARNGADLKRLE